MNLPPLHGSHTDHLNTPRLVADAAGTTVWRWDQQEPFGDNPADENPSGLGAFELPLRLPGQRYDKETNLHYNYFRDYDPNIGRYAQSDPLGIAGGLDTYGYTHGDPLGSTDPFGLLTLADLLPEMYEGMLCFPYAMGKVADWKRRIELEEQALGPCQRKCYIMCFFVTQSPLGPCPRLDYFEIFPYSRTAGCVRPTLQVPRSPGHWRCKTGVITGRSDKSCCADY